MTVGPIGFIGLGNMGGALAANLVGAGREVVSHDAAGPERNVEGATFVADVGEVARRATVIVFSLPDGHVSESVAREVIAAGPDSRCTHVVDTSTTGVRAAGSIEAMLRDAGIAYVDAPVSGGPAGARARTLAVMYAGADEACDVVEPVLAGLSDRLLPSWRPSRAGAGLKLANNFLSATALAATSEAIAFGQSVGLDMATMLSVLNAVERTEHGDERQVPQPCADRAVRVRLQQLVDGQGRAPLCATPSTEQGRPLAIGRATAALWERFADRRAGRRLHPHLPVRGQR